MAQLFLIRHAAPLIDPSVDPRHWLLSAEGEEAAHTFAQSIPAPPGPLYTSLEPKAVKTAMVLAAEWGTKVESHPGLHEVSGRGWSGSKAEYEVSVIRYLRGEPVPGWEEQASAQSRVAAALDRILSSRQEVVVVSHGLVLVLLISSLLRVEPDTLIPMWQSMRFPDLCILDSKRRRVLRSFGQPIGQPI
jgi:broad specificity phosphatase PhoE